MRTRRPRLLTLSILAAAIPVLVSLRYALIYSPNPSLRFGLIAGGLWLQFPNAPSPPSKAPFATAPMRPPVVLPHRTFDAYRHGFAPQLWFDHTFIVGESYSAPLWPLFALALAFPATSFIRRRLAYRPWQCQSCGYDLRGTPNATCPECGNMARASSP